MKKAAFYTLGCKVNQYETEAMCELFKNAGYEIVNFEDFADVYVINTCTVTNMSDRKSRQIIRRANKRNPDAVVAVTGCYAQIAPEAVREIQGVNIIIGTQDRKSIVELVENTGDFVLHVSDIMHTHTFEDLSVKTYADRTRAYIKIQEGCNQFCSYCIIPYTRGPIRSRSFSEIIEEVQRLAGDGFTEVVFTGIHVASYGLDTGEADLADLIAAANRIEGIKRLRLSSIEPMTLNTAFIDRIQDCEKLCPHFHISLQSGCDETLKRMNRKYTCAEYAGIVKGLRTHFPDAAITTDIMVGFAGETDEEFLKTTEFVKKMEFADIHIFQYSQRKGTPAAERTDQIHSSVKEQRSKVIADIARQSRQKFQEKFIGKTIEVLFEQPCVKGYFEGKTPNYLNVLVPSQENLSGIYAHVLLEEITPDGIRGKIARTL